MEHPLVDSTTMSCSIENVYILGAGGPNPFVPMEDAHPMFPTLVEMRAALERVVEVLVAGGDGHLFYLSGLELISEADAGKLRELLPTVGAILHSNCSN